MSSHLPLHAFHHLATQLHTRCTCLKNAMCGHCTYFNNSQFISCGFTQPKITCHQINCQKINQDRQIRYSQREHTHRRPKQGRRKQISRWAPICSLHVPCTWPALPNHSPDVLLHIVRTHAFSAYCRHKCTCTTYALAHCQEMMRGTYALIHILSLAHVHVQKHKVSWPANQGTNEPDRFLFVCREPVRAVTYHRDATNMTSFPFHFQTQSKIKGKAHSLLAHRWRGEGAFSVSHGT